MSPHRIELIVKVRADIPEQNYGANVRVVFPVPQTSGTVSTKLGSAAVGQSAEYIARDQKVIWNIKVRPFRKRTFSRKKKKEKAPSQSNSKRSIS